MIFIYLKEHYASVDLNLDLEVTQAPTLIIDACFQKLMLLHYFTIEAAQTNEHRLSLQISIKE